jgi:predicted ester cyclase
MKPTRPTYSPPPSRHKRRGTTIRAAHLPPPTKSGCRPLAVRSGNARSSKASVFTLVVMNTGVLDELYAPRLAVAARRWIEPFLNSFMRIIELVAEGETVVGRCSCAGTHTNTWLGHRATWRRFTNVAELYFFRVVNGRVTRAWGLEDTADRLLTSASISHAWVPKSSTKEPHTALTTSSSPSRRQRSTKADSRSVTSGRPSRTVLTVKRKRSLISRCRSSSPPLSARCSSVTRLPPGPRSPFGQRTWRE